MSKKRSRFLLWVILIIVTPLLIDKSVLANTAVKVKRAKTDVYMDGSNAYFDVFNINGDSYCELSDMALYFNDTSSRFNVVWNKSNKTINVTTGKNYVDDFELNMHTYDKYYNAKVSTTKLYINGKLSNIKGYTIDGRNYYKLRDLSKAIPFDMEVSSDKKSIYLYSPTPKNAYKTTVAYDTVPNEHLFSYVSYNHSLEKYMVYNNDNTISVIETNIFRIEDNIKVETYDLKFKLVSKGMIEYELPEFGAFYSGEKYNYIAFGQYNIQENDKKEVIRIVRYDKSFKRIDSVSVKGGESDTRIPFSGGCGRMSENGNYLVFHTSHVAYGNNNQPLTIIVDTSSMKVINNDNGYGGRSYDQYVQFDGKEHVLVDQGNSAVVLNKGYIDESDNSLTYYSRDLFDIPETMKVGVGSSSTWTGVHIGGFEVSSENYIVAMNSFDHSLAKDYAYKSFDQLVNDYTYSTMVGLMDQRDIIICSLPKNDIFVSEVKQITIAKYVGTNKLASTPKLVKISEDKFMVLWQEYDLKDKITGDVKYVFIDKAGRSIGKINTLKNFRLSDCNPLVIDNKVIWYTNEKGGRTFYTIPLK